MMDNITPQSPPRGALFLGALAVGHLSEEPRPNTEAPPEPHTPSAPQRTGADVPPVPQEVPGAAPAGEGPPSSVTELERAHAEDDGSPPGAVASEENPPSGEAQDADPTPTPIEAPDLAVEMPGPPPDPTPPASPLCLSPGEPPWLLAAAATHPGRVRNVNEDRYLLATWGSPQTVLAAVFDGLGGQGGGDVAAHIAAQGLRRCLADPLPDSSADRYETLLRGLYTADDAIHRRGRMELGRGGMGTTVVLALLSPTRGLHLYAGDSRLYYFRDGQRLMQTRDHTIVQIMVDTGRLRPEEVSTHPLRSQLTSCLGGAGSPGSLVVEPPFTEDSPEQPAVLHPRPGDTILLCSDGLCGEISPETLDDLVHRHGSSPEELVQRCIEAALGTGGRDNITVVALHYPVEHSGGG